jgi:hypothetical protein
VTSERNVRSVYKGSLLPILRWFKPPGSLADDACSSIVGAASQPGIWYAPGDGHRVATDNTERGPTAEHQGNGATSAIGVTV